MILTRTLLALAFVAITSADTSDYKLNDPMTYQESLDYCKGKGLYLMAVKSSSKNKYLYIRMKNDNVQNIWIGVSRRQWDTDERPWEWIYDGLDGLLVKKFFWAPAQSAIFKNNKERCVEMVDNSYSGALRNWATRKCEDKLPFYCETY